MALASISTALPDGAQRRRRTHKRVRTLHHASLSAAHIAYPSALRPDDDPPKWMIHAQSRDLPLSSRIRNGLTSVLCLLSLGHTSMSKVWEISRSGHDDAWNAFREGLAYRTANMNIVVCSSDPIRPSQFLILFFPFFVVRSCSHSNSRLPDHNSSSSGYASVYCRLSIYLHPRRLYNGTDLHRLWLLPSFHVERSRGKILPCTSQRPTGLFCC
jgi:hypothetical protein